MIDEKKEVELYQITMTEEELVALIGRWERSYLRWLRRSNDKLTERAGL